MADIQQLRDFLTVYNTLTEKCFQACVRSYNSHFLATEEETCVTECKSGSYFMTVLQNKPLKFYSNKVNNQEQKQLRSLYLKQCQKISRQMNVISEHGFRSDGRRSHQIRNISTRLGVYQQAEGSAYIEQGNTKILCAVYGPHEGKRSWQLENRAVINCQFSSATFSGLERKNRPRGDRKSNEFARLLEKTFESVILTELYPRAQIDIFCEGDGSQLAACVNAASLALADAGIPMKGLVSACTCTFVDGTSVVDITSREENDILPRLTIATVSGKDEVVLVELQNRVHVENLGPLLAEAKAIAANVHECLHAAVNDHLLKSAALL